MELRGWGISVSIVEADNVATPIWGKLADAATNQADRLLKCNLFMTKTFGDAEATAALDPRHAVERVASSAMPSANRPKTRYPVGFGPDGRLGAVI